MSREWFQGGHCGAKIPTSPAPLIYKQMPYNWLHSAIFSLQKESTSFSQFQTASSPSLESKHPKKQRSTSTHILNTQLWAQDQLNISWACTAPISFSPFHPPDPTRIQYQESTTWIRGHRSHSAHSSQGPCWDPCSGSHSTPSPPLLQLWEQDTGNCWKLLSFSEKPDLDARPFPKIF